MGCALTASLIFILIILLGAIALIGMDMGLDIGIFNGSRAAPTDPFLEDVIKEVAEEGYEVYDTYHPPTEASGKIKPNAADVRTKEGPPNKSDTSEGGGGDGC